MPRQGDIVWITLDPQLGHEQKGRRPGLVISNNDYIRLTGMIMICSITNTDNGFPLHISLKDYETTGYIMVEQLRSVDFRVRQVEYIETIRDDDLTEVLSKLQACT